MAAATSPVIDPRGLPEPVLAGERCYYENCRRALPGLKTLLGQTPDGTPVFACGDHDLRHSPNGDDQ